MRRHTVIIFLLILITACAKVEVEQATIEIPKEPVSEEPEMPSPPAEPEIVKEVAKEEIIEINEDSFEPVNKTIKINNMIKWVNKDTREHKIACYLKGTRVTTSQNLMQGETFEYTFTNFGEYICLDAIYGLRGTINVVMQKDFISITGGTVAGGSEKAQDTLLAGIVVAIIVVLLFWKYNKKHTR